MIYRDELDFCERDINKEKETIDCLQAQQYSVAFQKPPNTRVCLLMEFPLLLLRHDSFPVDHDMYSAYASTSGYSKFRIIYWTLICIVTYVFCESFSTWHA
jgi:hypothetical protein